MIQQQPQADTIPLMSTQIAMLVERTAEWVPTIVRIYRRQWQLTKLDAYNRTRLTPCFLITIYSTRGVFAIKAKMSQPMLAAAICVSSATLRRVYGNETLRKHRRVLTLSVVTFNTTWFVI